MAQPAVLEAELAPYFTTKAPFQFPINFREGFVKFWPIVTLVLLILAAPGILLFLGIGTALMPATFMGGASVGFAYSISMILAIVGLVLSILALPGLFNRKRSGWVYSYYAQLISVVTSILSFSLFGVLLGLLFLMLLFQVREYYN
ncbi:MULTISPECIES: chromate transporter [unclassified Spirosoma]|uniref:chromate transporter n=1 Tax=unclassified Spirosoma TaxID=2621999 RepID=UPI000960E1D1|nr:MULTISPECIES: chromate transporter [unclassified Spirosoma]MBN8826509.1 chromate transporter [Spirosoma sp.]OJW76400.1 MAG: chromate transporter [Spirosoma sp. 48-14]